MRGFDELIYNQALNGINRTAIAPYELEAMALPEK